MFFRRKKKKPLENREHYRRAPGKKHALSLALQLSDGSQHQANIENLSAGGAGIRFEKDDPKLEIGAKVNIGVMSLSHGAQVRTPGTVVGVRGSKAEGVAYGLQFTDVAGLFAQLDSYLMRFFNRRKAMRVLPALGKKLQVTALVGHEEVRVAANDISWMGLSFLLDPGAAESFLPIEEFQASFSLSKGAPPIESPVRLAHKTLTGAKVLFGGYFVHPDPKVGDEQRRILEEYMTARQEDMARWDAGK